jgi:hypothetical protein
MKTEKIPTTLPESWFIERVGENIMANSSSFNGMMKITDESHAKYLCHTSQKYFNFLFSEYDRIKSNNP